MPTMMMTSDVSLITCGKYRAKVKELRADPSKFEDAFRHAWYKLMTRDMGPATRCLGDAVPPPQPFQDFIPPHPGKDHFPDFTQISQDLQALVTKNPSLLGGFFRLAYSCAHSFRSTDYKGGCNGGRLFPWAINAGTEELSQFLEEIHGKYNVPGKTMLSMADLMVFAGTVAVQVAARNAANKDVFSVPFCPGRMDKSLDATEPNMLEHLEPKASLLLNYPVREEGLDLGAFVEANALHGLTVREFVALAGGARALNAVHPDAAAFGVVGGVRVGERR